MRPSSLRPGYEAVIAAVLSEAGLDDALTVVAEAAGGGRGGSHAPRLGHLLAEMQVLARQHPGASW